MRRYCVHWAAVLALLSISCGKGILWPAHALETVDIEEDEHIMASHDSDSSQGLAGGSVADHAREGGSVWGAPAGDADDEDEGPADEPAVALPAFVVQLDGTDFEYRTQAATGQTTGMW
jgi:hypothetical protein